MDLEPLKAEPVRFPPGHVAVRLGETHRAAYRRLYATYRSNYADLPVLRDDRDFDGRPVKLSQRQFQALSQAFELSQQTPRRRTGATFEAQERGRSRLYRKTQYLS